MIERSENLRLASESGEPLGIVSVRVGQNLQRDVPVELGVAGAVDLAHATGTNGSEDFVRTEAGAGREGHGGSGSSLAGCRGGDKNSAIGLPVTARSTIGGLR